MNKTVKGLFEFIEESPSQFHVVENERQRFLKEGFEELNESKEWNLKLGKNYFVTKLLFHLIPFLWHSVRLLFSIKPNAVRIIG